MTAAAQDASWDLIHRLQTGSKSRMHRMRTAAYSITAVSVVNRPEKASQNRTIVKIGIELQSVDSPTWEDFAIMAMVERGMGVGILPDMILRRIP